MTELYLCHECQCTFCDGGIRLYSADSHGYFCGTPCMEKYIAEIKERAAAKAKRMQSLEELQAQMESMMMGPSEGRA